MSTLLLDAGNSALKWLLVPAQQWPANSEAGLRGSVAIGAPDLATLLADALRTALRQAAAGAPDLILGCAVSAPSTLAAIELGVHGACTQPVTWLCAQERYDHAGIVLENRYARPEQLGADRWHALIGARVRHARGALLVVNAGTATTVDAVDAGGRFLGGVIAPGLGLMRGSLASGTARLPLAGGHWMAHPDNTDDAIHTGILEAQIGLVERRWQALQQASGPGGQLLLCGGAAPALLDGLQALRAPGTVIHEPELVLRGLWSCAQARRAATSTDRGK